MIHASSNVLALAAGTKRLKGQELMKDSYLTHQATSFAGRQAEQRLEEAQRVRASLAAGADRSWFPVFCVPLMRDNCNLQIRQLLASIGHWVSCWMGRTPGFGPVLQVCETLDRRRGMTESPMWLVEPSLLEPSLLEQEEATTEEAEPGPVNLWAELPVAERLSDVLLRLRTEYSYCIFCGCQVHREHLDRTLQQSLRGFLNCRIQ